MDLTVDLVDGAVPWSHDEQPDVHGQLNLLEQGTDYEPSVLTDFHAMLPVDSDMSMETMAESYDPERVVQSAWKSLANKEVELPWEGGFWDKFLGPNIPAIELFTRGIKRPLPFHVESASSSAEVSEVGRRAMSTQTVDIKNFLQHIRDVPIRTWQEEREAVWETAVRRWVVLLDQWNASDTPLLLTLQSKTTFVEKAQILVDVFFNKAPQTLMKRVNSLVKLCSTLRGLGVAFPCTEEQFYLFLKGEINLKAPASRLKAFFEAIVFSRYVLGVEVLQNIVSSRRCLGASLKSALTCPRQAMPFTVVQLRRFHEILREGEELWDRAMCGMILFCTYGRSRWSDSQHAEDLIQDRDDQGVLQFLEIKASVHKTARALHMRHMFLPVAAPAVGVTDECWGEQWMLVRRMLKIEDLNVYPLMPAPDSSLEPTPRPVSTSEAKKWIQYLLGSELFKPGMTLTSHSCKCTCLSYLAKRGASYEDRLVLGYHANKLRVAMTYSRDSAARPLALLCQVLQEFRQGQFEPDCTRSGRLKSGAKPLTGDFQVSHVGHGNDVHDTTEVLSDEHSDVELVGDPATAVKKESSAGVLDAQDLSGHATTGSSDSSGEEISAWAPVVGHYIVDIPSDKRLWANRNTKMFHLSHGDCVRVLLCGRRVTSSFVRHEDPIRFDAAKCRQCFRLKNSER